MKKTMLFILTGLMGITVMAQENEKEEKDEKQEDVPVVVKDAFAKDFPAVKNVTWGAEDKDFEAEFKLNGVDCSANYNKAGHRLETETTIQNDQLPKTALDYISKNFSGYKLTEAANITDDKNVIKYETEIELNGESIELIFDANGKFLEKEEAEGEED
jgi:hypothetical protein